MLLKNLEETKAVKESDSDELVERYGRANLADIMSTGYPERARVLEAWVTAGQEDPEGGLIKLRTSDGKELVTTRYDKRTGKPIVIGPNGRKVPRKLAIELWYDYGPEGRYRGIDQATGYSRSAWVAFKNRNPEQAALIVAALGHEPRFIENHIVHDTSDWEKQEQEGSAGDGTA